MAKLRSGILGKASGAIANVVTSSWKGINYARERVIPANPKSTGQTRVRGTLSAIVLIGRAVKTLFINTYWESLVKGTANSGWAKYVGTNQKAIQKEEDYENLKLATGNLEGSPSVGAVINGGTNKVDFTWSADTVSNGLPGDVVYLHAYVPERNYVYSQSASYIRSASAGSISIPDIADLSGNIYAYLTIKKADGSLYSTTQGSIAT